jgi:hypothetical protein
MSGPQLLKECFEVQKPGGRSRRQPRDDRDEQEPHLKFQLLHSCVRTRSRPPPGN